MNLKFFLLVVLFFVDYSYCSECSSYRVLNSRDRAQGVHRGNTLKCDQYDLTNGWYRFMGDAGSAMPTSCVPKHHCGTHAPGWIQGSHPTKAEGIVTRKVCYHWSSNCCNWSNNIRVRNCGGFYVYELVKPPVCSLRYCGDGRRKACHRSPCHNGGSCHDIEQKGHRCECSPGFTGKQCETNVTTTVTCEEHYMQINLTTVHFPGVDWRTLHLKDKSCRATRTAFTISLRSPLNGCGTTYREHNNKIAFWNEVSNDGRGFGADNQSTVTRGSFGNFTFTMDLYQTSRYQTPYSPFLYPVVVYPNQPLWVQYEVKNTNADLVVFAESCRATPSNDPNASPQHVFIQRGCVNDPTMVYSYDPYSRVQRFSIRSFRFVYSSSFYVYLHCELIVCHRNTTNSRCARGCVSSRRRRETTDMDGSNEYDLSAGPFKKPNVRLDTGKQKGEESSKANLPLIGGLAAFGGVFLLVTILLSVKMIRRMPAHVTRPSAANVDVTVNSYEQQGVEQDEKGETKA